MASTEVSNQPSAVFSPAFTFADPLAKWQITAQQWLAANNSNLNGIATGVIVFDPSGRVLLIQRAITDSMPNRWEFPGGAVDPEDESLLHGAARELWEESGLVATRFTFFVPETPGTEVGTMFTNRNGTKHFCRFTFIAEVEDWEKVVLDPKEHQDYVWATEEEVREQKIGEREIPITMPPIQALLLEAFRIRQSL
ncbi:hypothetical protein S40293_01666 [Stachybotrys chartarum IBT 40293]|nr:hypothetical protein S40293_01666 [Stachybotrys chartarum IBT 40293]